MVRSVSVGQWFSSIRGNTFNLEFRLFFESFILCRVLAAILGHEMFHSKIC